MIDIVRKGNTGVEGSVREDWKVAANLVLTDGIFFFYFDFCYAIMGEITEYCTLT